MNNPDYYIVNNEFSKEELFYKIFNNRAFKYGDALFETIHAYGTKPQFLEKHINRLHRSMDILKMEIPAELTINAVYRQIEKLLNKNRIFGGARIRINVFRDSEGLYTPQSNKSGYIIVSNQLEKGKYELNDTGLMTDIYHDMKKPVNILANLKTTNSLLYVLAGIYKSERGLDDCFILNEKDHVIESISSNIFLIKDQKIYTPGLKEGCLAGVMRMNIIKLLRFLDYHVNDNCSLTIRDIETADEIFLTNAIEGIKWILAFRKKRYYNKFSKILIEKLNEFAFPD